MNQQRVIEQARYCLASHTHTAEFMRAAAIAALISQGIPALEAARCVSLIAAGAVPGIVARYL